MGSLKGAPWAAISRSVDGKKGVLTVFVVPDRPGRDAMGKTIDEALRNAAFRCRRAGEVALADGDKIPQLRPAEAVRADSYVAEAWSTDLVMAIVPLVLNTGRPAKANLSLDAGLLQAIDEAGEAKGLTRSAFIASAAREKIVEDGATAGPIRRSRTKEVLLSEAKDDSRICCAKLQAGHRHVRGTANRRACRSASVEDDWFDFRLGTIRGFWNRFNARVRACAPYVEFAWQT